MKAALTGAITAESTFEDEFRAFYFRGDRPSDVEQHVYALKADLEGVGLAAGDCFALLSLASRCMHCNSRYAQSSKRGVELPRL